MSETSVDLHSAIAPHLPLLRRYGRALTGNQASGDKFTAATLEAILADDAIFDSELTPKAALFKVFNGVWIANHDFPASGESQSASMAQTADERLSELAPRARQAFLLGALEDFSTGEIAVIMGVTTAEAEMLVKSGVEQIRAQTQARVMIIEDEPIIAMDVREIVEELGHHCVGVADTCAEAVALAAQSVPELVLADIQLADGSSGIDAVRQILAAQAIPAIFITAYPERLLTGERPEPVFLISKPFKRAAVEAAVSQALFFRSAAAIEDLPEG